MPAYVTRAEFLNQGLPSEALLGVGDALIDQALLWASRRADGYISKRYRLPLQAWEDDLKAIVVDLACYFILTRIGFNPNSQQDSIVIKRYDDALAMLRDISRKEIELIGVLESPSDDNEIAAPLVSSDKIED
jgi:phage gp36-like protein